VCATVGHTVEGGVVTKAQLCATVGHTVEGGVVTQAQLCATVGHTVEVLWSPRLSGVQQ